MSDKIKVFVTIEDNDDYIQEDIEMNYYDALLMLQSNKICFLDYFEKREEKYRNYVIENSKFHYSKDANEKVLDISFVYAKEKS